MEAVVGSGEGVVSSTMLLFFYYRAVFFSILFFLCDDFLTKSAPRAGSLLPELGSNTPSGTGTGLSKEIIVVSVLEKHNVIVGFAFWLVRFRRGLSPFQLTPR